MHDIFWLSRGVEMLRLTHPPVAAVATTGPSLACAGWEPPRSSCMGASTCSPLMTAWGDAAPVQRRMLSRSRRNSLKKWAYSSIDLMCLICCLWFTLDFEVSLFWRPTYWVYFFFRLQMSRSKGCTYKLLKATDCNFFLSLPLPSLPPFSQDGSVHFSEGEGMPRRFRHDRGDIQEDRKLQRCRAQQAGPSPQSPPHSTENLASSGKQVQAGAADRTSSHKSVISKVPLRVNLHALWYNVFNLFFKLQFLLVLQCKSHGIKALW